MVEVMERRLTRTKRRTPREPVRRPPSDSRGTKSPLERQTPARPFAAVQEPAVNKAAEASGATEAPSLQGLVSYQRDVLERAILFRANPERYVVRALPSAVSSTVDTERDDHGQG
jgi:hypothetical protein